MTKKTRPIYCERCSGEITVRDDLIVSHIFLETVPYHSECFGSDLNSKKTFWLSNEPLNGPFSTITGYLCFIGALVLVFIPDLRLYSIPLFILSAIRLYIWFAYERHIEK